MLCRGSGPLEGTPGPRAARHARCLSSCRGKNRSRPSAPCLLCLIWPQAASLGDLEGAAGIEGTGGAAGGAFKVKPRAPLPAHSTLLFASELHRVVDLGDAGARGRAQPGVSVAPDPCIAGGLIASQVVADLVATWLNDATHHGSGCAAPTPPASSLPTPCALQRATSSHLRAAASVGGAVLPPHPAPLLRAAALFCPERLLRLACAWRRRWWCVHLCERSGSVPAMVVAAAGRRTRCCSTCTDGSARPPARCTTRRCTTRCRPSWPSSLRRCGGGEGFGRMEQLRVSHPAHDKASLPSCFLPGRGQGSYCLVLRQCTHAGWRPSGAAPCCAARWRGRLRRLAHSCVRAACLLRSWCRRCGGWARSSCLPTSTSSSWPPARATWRRPSGEGALLLPVGACSGHTLRSRARCHRKMRRWRADVLPGLRHPHTAASADARLRCFPVPCRAMLRAPRPTLAATLTRATRAAGTRVTCWRRCSGASSSTGCRCSPRPGGTRCCSATCSTGAASGPTSRRCVPLPPPRTIQPGGKWWRDALVFHNHAGVLFLPFFPFQRGGPHHIAPTLDDVLASFTNACGHIAACCGAGEAALLW